MWTLFLYPLGGPLQAFFGLFGLRSEFLGGQPAEAFAWVIVVQIWSNLGMTMVIFLAGLATIPTEVYEAARIDGASRWQVFREVTWPLLTPAVNTNLVLTIIGSLQAWQLFLVLTGYRAGHPGHGLPRVRDGLRPDRRGPRPGTRSARAMARRHRSSCSSWCS